MGGWTLIMNVDMDAACVSPDTEMQKLRRVNIHASPTPAVAPFVHSKAPGILIAFEVQHEIAQIAQATHKSVIPIIDVAMNHVEFPVMPVRMILMPAMNAPTMIHAPTNGTIVDCDSDWQMNPVSHLARVLKRIEVIVVDADQELGCG